MPTVDARQTDYALCWALRVLGRTARWLPVDSEARRHQLALFVNELRSPDRTNPLGVTRTLLYKGVRDPPDCVTLRDPVRDAWLSEKAPLRDPA